MPTSDKLDVWFVTANTVYQGVPLSVVCGWAEQGRVAIEDRVRVNADAPWVRLGEHPIISGFFRRSSESVARRTPTTRPETTRTPAIAAMEAPVHLDDVDYEPPPRARAIDDDDDVDMIPLIDISLVLLIFFMMTMAVSSVSPVSVPELKHTGELENPDNAITVIIDKRTNGEVYFALSMGKSAPLREENYLTSQDELLTRLDARIGQGRTPPAVRIACHESLPRIYVQKIGDELATRQAKKLIASFAAEVHEKK